MRDAAYSLLTVDDRTVGHRLVGRYLESHGEQNPLLWPNTFSAATCLRLRPCICPLRAAERALLVSDFEQALRLSEQGSSAIRIPTSWQPARFSLRQTSGAMAGRRRFQWDNRRSSCCRLEAKTGAKPPRCCCRLAVLPKPSAVLQHHGKARERRAKSRCAGRVCSARGLRRGHAVAWLRQSRQRAIPTPDPSHRVCPAPKRNREPRSVSLCGNRLSAPRSVVTCGQMQRSRAKDLAVRSRR